MQRDFGRYYYHLKNTSKTAPSEFGIVSLSKYAIKNIQKNLSGNSHMHESRIVK